LLYDNSEINCYWSIFIFSKN